METLVHTVDKIDSFSGRRHGPLESQLSKKQTPKGEDRSQVSPSDAQWVTCDLGVLDAEEEPSH